MSHCLNFECNIAVVLDLIDDKNHKTGGELNFWYVVGHVRHFNGV
jgi:hypothetical protein